MEENKKTEETIEGSENIKDKKIKNLISTAILLGGLFLGSLFVDVVQVIKGSGFSPRNLNKAEIFESSGKTWVAYGEPMVKASIITDDKCDKCDPSEALVWLRRVMPTINAQKIAFDSAEGKKMVNDLGVKILPAFIFADNIVKTEFYNQAKVLFEEKNKQFFLNTQELGLAPGKYLELPKITDADITFGKFDSNVKVVVFSDFQCPYCKLFWSSLREAMKQYGDKVLFSYKHLPLSLHSQSENAALASDCAQEQGKFWEFGDKLFSSQSEWGNSQGTQKFKDYGRNLKLNTGKFNQCLDSKKYQDQINADKSEADSFGISGTPATFINGQFKNGVASFDDLKATIEEELNK